MDIVTEGELSSKTCIIVDEEDNFIKMGGLAECHVVPMTLHRAFSVFIFDDIGNLLLQQRAKTKYTFPLSWTNSICSHPRNLKKSIEEWIDLRIKDEFDGWTIKNIQERLRPVGKLMYEARSDQMYGEKEVDTIFFLQISEQEKREIRVNPSEIEAVQWVSDAELEKHFQDDSVLLTPWFRAIYQIYKPLYKNMKEYCADSPTGELPYHKVGDVSYTKPIPDYDYLLQLPYSYIRSNPGKAIRSLLCRVYAEIDTSVSAKDCNAVAEIIERIHAASLLHDDIEDKSSMRRGAMCAHKLYGVARTLNTGTFNFLNSLSSLDSIMSEYPVKARYEMITSTLSMLLELHRAQGSDIFWAENGYCPILEDYLEMIKGKTSALFKHCAILSGLCGNPNVGEQIGKNFEEFGIFFQVRDDYSNICDPSYWKAKGFYEDADEGKYSYPVILFLDREDIAETKKSWLRKRLAQPDGMAVEDKLFAYELLYESGCLKETRDALIERKTTIENALLPLSPLFSKIMEALYIVEVLPVSEVKSLLKKL